MKGLPILKKEFNDFFSSISGWIIVILFLLSTGSFLFIFDGENNLLDYGFADLRNFFSISAWIFVFIVPAITMKSFAEEKNTGTIEHLLTLPIKKYSIVIQKFLGYLFIILVILIFTSVYSFSIYHLGFPKGNLDIASIVGSYLGLILLVSIFVSIGLFTSVISNKQTTAFFIGVFLCFFIFFGLDALASYSLLGKLDFYIKLIGLNYHYESISKGVLDTRDLSYFLVLIVFFCFLTVIIIERVRNKRKYITFISIFIFSIIFFNKFYLRVDLTEDKRYSISETTRNILDSVDSEDKIKIKVYLEGNNFPAGFRRFRNEIKLLLEEYKFYNSNLSFEFIDPFSLEKSNQDTLFRYFSKKRLQPTRLQVEKDNERSTKMIFPYAEIFYKEKSNIINLLSTQTNIPKEEQLNNSIQTLEYKFSNAINFLIKKNKIKITFSEGHGEPIDLLLMDAMYTLSSTYQVSRLDLTIRDEKLIPVKQKYLFNNDILIIIKPLTKFNSNEKYLIDQYIMKGGKVIWALDFVHAETSEIENNGKFMAMPIDLNLTDMLFKYGLRVEPKLIQDSHCGEILVQSGEISGNPQYEKMPWIYYPVMVTNPKNPVVKDIELIRAKYPSYIEILNNHNNNVTVILKTSPFTRVLGVPREISLDEIKLWNKDIFNNKSYNIGVFLEGRFSSAYKNRVKPFEIENSIDSSDIYNKMVVFSDGDLFINEVKSGSYIPLNVDKWTGREFGNKDLLENVVSYLTNEEGIISLRNKKIKLRLLDRLKISKEKNKWRVINIGFPIVILFILNFGFSFYRKKKYTK